MTSREASYEICQTYCDVANNNSPEVDSNLGEESSCLQRLVPRTPQPTIATDWVLELILAESLLNEIAEGIIRRSNESIIVYSDYEEDVEVSLRKSDNVMIPTTNCKL